MIAPRHATFPFPSTKSYSDAFGKRGAGQLLNDDCSSVWAQTFSYDQYDNLAQSGSVSWGCSTCYNSANNHYNTTSSIYYDTGGNLLSDSFHKYAWDGYNKLASVDISGANCASGGECLVYDALGRTVEIDSGSTYTEIWYTQLGKTAYMNGSTVNYAYWPTPGGGTVEVTGNNTNAYYMHKDWLGNSRISSNVVSHSVISDQAYAPYGEVYNQLATGAGVPAQMFTGDTQDVVAGIYDTPNRELAGSNQGRWLSPDPAGAGWNLYAYAANNPLIFVDPLGLQIGNMCPGDQTGEDGGCSGGGGGGGGGGDFCDASGDCGAGTGVDGWGNTGVNGVPWNWGPDYVGTIGSGASGLLAQQNGWYASCVSYNFQCDANGNYVPPDGAYVITVSCGGSFAQINCAAPPQAAAGSQSLSIYTSLGMQNGLSLLAQYQADPMSSSGKDILQQLSQMSGAAQKFIIMGYAGSVFGAAGGAIGADYAAGPLESNLFGRYATAQGGGFPGFLNDPGYPMRLGYGWNGDIGEMVFRLSIDPNFHFDFWTVPFP